MNTSADQDGNRYGNRSEQVPKPSGNSWGCVVTPQRSQADSEPHFDVLASLGYRRPAFHYDALCREYRHVEFHPGRGQSADPALQVCGRCLVRAECLEWAMADPSLLGVLGGTSYRTRRARHALDLRRAKEGRAS